MNNQKNKYLKLKLKITGVIVFVFLFVLFLIWRKTYDHKNVFYKKLFDLCWIAYAPTNFNPRENIYPSIRNLTEDLTFLKRNGFDGVVTFGSEKTLGQIPKIAKKLGFKGIIMGIWNLGSREEFNQAVAAKNYVDGYCVGHLGLYKNYGFEDLQEAITRLRENTDRPISTSQNLQLYEKNNKIINLGDWLFPDVRLFWDIENFKTPKNLYQKLVEKYERLVGISEKPVLMKTVGFPTGGSKDASENNQAEFFKLLLENEKNPFERVPFVYHEAFDQSWKNWHPIEQYWGLFKNDRTAKVGSKYIWGLNLKQKSIDIKYIKGGDFLYISIAIILFSALIFLIWMPKDLKNKLIRSKKTLRLVKDEKKVIFIDNGNENVLFFDQNHDTCFDVFYYLSIKFQENPLLCGEILKIIKNDNISIGCSFNEEGGCNGKKKKKAFCQPYKTLSNHRIRPIKQMLFDNKIGEIKNIKGESRWKLTINPNINLEIIKDDMTKYWVKAKDYFRNL